MIGPVSVTPGNGTGTRDQPSWPSASPTWRGFRPRHNELVVTGADRQIIDDINEVSTRQRHLESAVVGGRVDWGTITWPLAPPISTSSVLCFPVSWVRRLCCAGG